MYKSILITREQEGALQTANKLLDFGYSVVLTPMISIVPSQIEKRADCKTDYVLITSLNAAKRVKDVYTNLSSSKIIAVGERSKQYLTSLGFTVAHVADHSQDLLSSIDDIIKPNSSIDFICGDHIANSLDVKLQNKGFSVNKIEVYKSIATQNFNTAVLENIDTVLFYSPRTATIFANLIKNKLNALSSIECICISQNVAEQIKHLGFKHIYISSMPTDDSLIDCINSHT